MTTAVICIAILSALVLVLGINVSRMRGSAQDQVPVRPDDPLFIAVRAHGNAAEWVPILAILMLVVGSLGASGWMTAAMLVATAARILHAIGVLTSKNMATPSPLRLGGAIGTYMSGLVLVAAALVLA